jgi:hypothetical protein
VTASGPFSAANRARLLHEYFDSVDDLDPARAWAHVYRLLLWVDRTTGLAHCYESDKCQPGRPWYARSLAFHAWCSDALDSQPTELAEDIDLLFRRVTADLAATSAARRSALSPRAEAQRAPYAGRGFPEPGEDSELEALISDALAAYMTTAPPTPVLRDLTEQIRAHVGQENKRKNLVGEGFEDTLAALLTRTTGIGDSYEISVRRALHEIRGFNPPRGGDKTNKVDLSMVRRSDGYRTLVSCKWSVRSDREEQFGTDFDDYQRLESAGEAFAYVLVTNEFDPARLAAACDSRRQNSLTFTDVVHVNPNGPVAAYAAPGAGRRRSAGGEIRALAHIESGRLGGLASWLHALRG